MSEAGGVGTLDKLIKSSNVFLVPAVHFGVAKTSFLGIASAYELQSRTNCVSLFSSPRTSLLWLLLLWSSPVFFPIKANENVHL